MALSIVYSRATSGIEAPLVTVEAHLSNGMPAFHIVGLPETAVKESRDRVRSAIVNSRFEFPIRHITINLGPADLPKEGGRFDLPIALGILAASAQIPQTILNEYEFIGELALSGELRAIRGLLPVVLGTYQAGRKLIVPIDNREEAALVAKANVFSANHLLAVCAHLKDETVLSKCELTHEMIQNNKVQNDLFDIKGQIPAKRALEIAAAGRHSVLYIGPPGTGKTMLASRLPTILPDLDENKALEVAAVMSISHKGFQAETWKKIPFRSPHHSTSNIALVGGGRPPKPGEISLAHHGVLFLDELPEFSRHVLECLREPLESGSITISRAGYQMLFPAHFQLIAAMNPCPCGYAGSATDQCQCSLEQIQRYLRKISGPLLDRIDMQVEVPRLPPDILTNNFDNETSAKVRKRVINAREYQLIRQGKYNSELNVPELDLYGKLNKEASHMLNEIMVKFNLSARVYHRIIKVARTIADIDLIGLIETKHVGEALRYRSLDRMKFSV